MTRRLTLLNPGPANLTPAVRAALALPDLCHREDEYVVLATEVRERVRSVYGPASPLASEYETVLFAGSGTTALEAMIGTFVPSEASALVLANGVYGERLAAICAALGIAHEVVDSGWLGEIDPADAERRIAARGHTFVLMVHHETTTGRLNPLAEIDAACARTGATLLVDAVSSYGAEELAFEAAGAFAVSSNKCLHGPAGLALVVARKDLLARRHRPRSVALDLRAYQREWPPFTPPIPIVQGLRVALEELGPGGADARRETYGRLAERIRDGVTDSGYELLLPRGAYGCSLTSFRLPEGLGYDVLHDRLKRLGYVVYAGQGLLSRSIFRIANMGDLVDEDLDGLLLGLAATRPSGASPALAVATPTG